MSLFDISRFTGPRGSRCVAALTSGFGAVLLLQIQTSQAETYRLTGEIQASPYHVPSNYVDDLGIRPGSKFEAYIQYTPKKANCFNPGNPPSTSNTLCLDENGNSLFQFILKVGHVTFASGLAHGEVAFTNADSFGWSALFQLIIQADDVPKIQINTTEAHDFLFVFDDPKKSVTRLPNLLPSTLVGFKDAFFYGHVQFANGTNEFLDSNFLGKVNKIAVCKNDSWSHCERE